jgi:hypothetical protein
VIQQLRAAQPHLDALAAVRAPLPPVRLHQGRVLQAGTTPHDTPRLHEEGRKSYYAARRGRAEAGPGPRARLGASLEEL